MLTNQIEYGDLLFFPLDPIPDEVDSISTTISTPLIMKISTHLLETVVCKSCVTYIPLSDTSKRISNEITHRKIKITRDGFSPSHYYSNLGQVMITSTDKRKLMIISNYENEMVLIEYNCNIVRVATSPISSLFIVELEGNKILYGGTEHLGVFDTVPLKHISCSSSSAVFISKDNEYFGRGKCRYIFADSLPFTSLDDSVMKIEYPFKEMNVRVDGLKSGFYHNLFLLSDGCIYG